MPTLDWLRHYEKADLVGDLVAGTIVAIMLIPQAMAYALLAGLPPQVGLYASILPLLLYALLGSSRTLAVGPVAIVSLMVANAITETGVANGIVVGMSLALLSGVIFIALGFARLGFLVNFISHSVVVGFTSAAALIIGASQLAPLLGLDIPRGNILETLVYVSTHLAETHPVTLVISVGAICILVAWPLNVGRVKDGKPGVLGSALSRAGPLAAVLAGTVMVLALNLEEGVAIVGEIPRGLPPFSLPTLELWRELLAPAVLIVFVGFMESVAIAKTLASKRRQKINANRELVALGAANLGASVTGAYPVTGGLSRSIVNFTAGAQTPLASIFTAGWVLITVFALTPLLYFLPKAVLAAVIVVAVVSLVDLHALQKTWRYNRADGVVLLVTFSAVLALGIESGILAGVGLSLALYLFRTSRPHIAVVGRVDNTEHYRNVLRHAVHTEPTLLTVRVDESLYFANTRYLEDYLLAAISDDKKIRHIVLIMSAVNFVDTSALDSLEGLIDELRDANVTTHLAEVKGPVMDQFEHSKLLETRAWENFSEHARRCDRASRELDF